MSLRTLLPLGRSFDSAADRAGRYRPAEAGVLPDFSAGRPARALGLFGGDEGGEVEGAGKRAASGGVAVREVASKEVASKEVASKDFGGRETGPCKEVGKEPGGAAGPAGAGGAGRPGVRRRLPLWLEEWLLVLFRPGNRRRLTRPVQPELDFSRVAVARNDLMTSDVEVVVVRAGRRPEAMSADCRKRVLRLWWEQGARRLRKLGNYLFLV